MSILFEPTAIAGMELINRFVRSATHDGCSTERGEVTDSTLDLYAGLARGGAGLIVSGFAFVREGGRKYLRQLAADRDELIPGLKKLAGEVHSHGAKIALQIVHCGRNARREEGAGLPVAPSVWGDAQAVPHRAMTAEEVEDLVEAFAAAAGRAVEAGFDAVQIHAAHSYLGSQFLSPCSNLRTDRWGGNTEGRMRFHSEVVKAVRKAIGRDMPLLIKLGVEDTVEGGMTLDEGCAVAAKLAALGVDAVEVSEGLETMGANHIKRHVRPGEGEAYYQAWAEKVKRSVNIPVIMVGGLRSLDLMERIVRERRSDLVSLCRPFIREPDLVNRWRRGDRRPAACISCNQCLKKIGREERLACGQLSVGGDTIR